MKANKIMEYLESYFPLSLQEPWDRCGLQIGKASKEVEKIMVALNADEKTLLQTIENHCDMLITHHPFMLEKIEKIDLDTAQGRCIQLALTNDIVVYSLHTCLDQGQNDISMNDWLMHCLPVHDVCCYDDVKIGKKAILNEIMTIESLVAEIKQVWNIPMVKYASPQNKQITSIAICGGSGADDLEILAKQVDCFVTGDSKYRHAKFAMDHDMALIDVGHHIEVIMEKKVKELLDNLSIEVIVANSEDYYMYK